MSISEKKRELYNADQLIAYCDYEQQNLKSLPSVRSSTKQVTKKGGETTSKGKDFMKSLKHAPIIDYSDWTKKGGAEWRDRFFP